MKFVHFDCAQQWLHEKYVNCSDSGNIIIFAWQDLICELCKSPMELNYLNNFKNEHILSSKPMKGSYLLIESLFPDEKKKNYLIYIKLKSYEEILIVTHFFVFFNEYFIF